MTTSTCADCLGRGVVPTEAPYDPAAPVHMTCPRCGGAGYGLAGGLADVSMAPSAAVDA